MPNVKHALGLWAHAPLVLIRTPGVLRKEKEDLRVVSDVPTSQTMLRNLQSQELKMHLSKSQISPMNQLAIN